MILEPICNTCYLLHHIPANKLNATFPPQFPNIVVFVRPQVLAKYSKMGLHPSFEQRRTITCVWALSVCM